MDKFNAIRPYFNEEIIPALRRLVDENEFISAVKYFLPEKSNDEIKKELLEITTLEFFQKNFLSKIVDSLVNRSIKNLTFDGIENLKVGESYLFVSNHRDIVLDSALLNIILVKNDHETVQIAIGSNLLIKPWIVDFVKINKSFIVQRDVPQRDAYESSHLLSSYIDFARNTLNESIWIAQREGRSKNGDDKTQPGLLKMLSLCSNGNFIEYFKSLKIVPVSISYEYDPCDVLKTQEIYSISNNKDYKKTSKDDLNSMLHGIIGYKGRVHFSIGKPLTDVLDNIDASKGTNDKIKDIASIIDYNIVKNYKLWPSNIFAYKFLNNKDYDTSNISQEEEIEFVNYVNKKFSDITSDVEEHKKIFFDMYSKPIENKINNINL